MYKYLMILALITMTGCSSLTKKQQEIIVYDKNKEVYVLPDADVLKECETLGKLKDGSFEDLMNITIDMVIKYKDCKEKQKNLKEWIIRNHSNK